MTMNDHTIEAYWQAYLAALPPNSPRRTQQYTAEQFGDTPEMAQQLGELVANGIKTATCSALF